MTWEEKKKEYFQNYYLENKDKYTQRGQVKTQCPTCQCVYMKKNASRHRKSKYHLNFLT